MVVYYVSDESRAKSIPQRRIGRKEVLRYEEKRKRLQMKVAFPSTGSLGSATRVILRFWTWPSALARSGKVTEGVKGAGWTGCWLGTRRQNSSGLWYCTHYAPPSSRPLFNALRKQLDSFWEYVVYHGWFFGAVAETAEVDTKCRFSGVLVDTPRQIGEILTCHMVSACRHSG